MAVAAGLARRGSGIVLADLALRGGQAILHQVEATEPGLEALVHAHQIGRPTPEEVHRHTLPLAGSAYHLLIGLRRPSLWTAIRPFAFDATLRSLRALFSVVVADVTGDVEGEAATGSVDVGERNHMARRSTATADVVVVVGADGPPAQRALDATIEAVQEHRGQATGIVRVRNGLWDDSDASPDDAIVVGRFRAAADLAEWGSPITAAVAALLDRRPVGFREPGPMLISPGSIGQWQGAR
jgi:hypothetical protein